MVAFRRRDANEYLHNITDCKTTDTYVEQPIQRSIMTRLPKSSITFVYISEFINIIHLLDIYDRGCARTIADHVMKVTDRKSAKINFKSNTIGNHGNKLILDACAHSLPPN